MESNQQKLNLLPVVIIFVVGAVIVTILVLARPKPIPQPEPGDPSPLQVSVVSANVKNTALSVTAQGTIEPKRAITLQAQVGGQVVEVSQSFENGGFFSKGDVLLTIDDSDYKVALVDAEARLADAIRQLAEEKGRVRQAKREWRDLGNSEANDLFKRKPQLAAAKAQVALAEARVDRAQLDLDRTKVKAPFAGRLQEKLVDAGQIVMPNTPIAAIYSQDAMQVRLPLTEQQVALIDLPLEKNTDIVPPAVRLTAKVAGEQSIWRGRLTRADAFVDENSRYFYAWVEIDLDPANPILPGLFVQANIEGKSIPGVTKLPRAALVNRAQIVLVDDNNKTVWRDVSVLNKTPEHVWVIGDIDSGDRVLLEKQTLAPVGTEVTTEEMQLAEVQQ